MKDCEACKAGLPLVWSVQLRKTMHLAGGLSVVSCSRIDEDRDLRNRKRQSP